MGVGGAIHELVTSADVVVLVDGDGYTSGNLARLIDVHRRKLAGLAQDSDRRRSVTLSLYRVSNPSQCGLVDLAPEGEVVRFVEKPPPEKVFTDLANAGLCVVEPGVLDYIPPGQTYDFGHDLFPRLLAAGAPLFGLPIAHDEFLIDIGTTAGLERARKLASTMRRK